MTKEEDDIRLIISSKKWDELIKCDPRKICQNSSYEEAMRLVDLVLSNNDDDNYNANQFAADFALEVRRHFTEKWESDWKNEVWLGDVCYFAYRYIERYEAYRRALISLEDPPEWLFVRLSKCESSPWPRPITKRESEEYLKRALFKKLTADVALAMASYYKGEMIRASEELKPRFEELFNHWRNLTDLLYANGIRSNIEGPDIFGKVPLSESLRFWD